MQVGQLHWHIVDSSAVHAIAYSREEQAIYVEFVRGAVFKYEEASIEDFEDFKGSKSVGQHIRILTENHPYSEVS